MGYAFLALAQTALLPAVPTKEVVMSEDTVTQTNTTEAVDAVETDATEIGEQAATAAEAEADAAKADDDE